MIWPAMNALFFGDDEPRARSASTVGSSRPVLLAGLPAKVRFANFLLIEPLGAATVIAHVPAVALRDHRRSRQQVNGLFYACGTPTPLPVSADDSAVEVRGRRRCRRSPCDRSVPDRSVSARGSQQRRSRTLRIGGSPSPWFALLPALSRLAKPHPCSATILVNKFDTCGFQRASNGQVIRSSQC
jgi:hypothetical protein